MDIASWIDFVFLDHRDELTRLGGATLGALLTHAARTGVAQYPPLMADDVRAAISYAAALTRDEELVPLR